MELIRAAAWTQVLDGSRYRQWFLSSTANLEQDYTDGDAAHHGGAAIGAARRGADGPAVAGWTVVPMTPRLTCARVPP